MLGDRGAGSDHVVAAVGQAGEDALEPVAAEVLHLQLETQLTRHRAHQLDIEARGRLAGDIEGRVGECGRHLEHAGARG